jgi:hypothetical protein
MKYKKIQPNIDEEITLGFNIDIIVGATVKLLGDGYVSRAHVVHVVSSGVDVARVLMPFLTDYWGHTEFTTRNV